MYQTNIFEYLDYSLSNLLESLKSTDDHSYFKIENSMIICKSKWLKGSDYIRFSLGANQSFLVEARKGQEYDSKRIVGIGKCILLYNLYKLHYMSRKV